MNNKKTKVFENYEQFAKYVKQKANKIINEEIESVGDPVKLTMNKNIESAEEKTGHKTSVDSKGKFKIETDAPINTPKESTATSQPTDVKMQERDEGTDEEWASAVSVKGTNSNKKVSNELADGLSKPDVTSKKDIPQVSKESDPTKVGGVPGSKDNDVKMNQEDKEDKQITPKTQVLGNGEKTGNNFSKGQTGQEINVKPKQEIDKEKEVLDAKIKTIQLPESFKNKKELLTFIKESAYKISDLI